MLNVEDPSSPEIGSLYKTSSPTIDVNPFVQGGMHFDLESFKASILAITKKI